MKGGSGNRVYALDIGREYSRKDSHKKTGSRAGFLAFRLMHGHGEPFGWCGRRDSNSHTLRRQNLNLVCLPISPRPRVLQTKTPGSAWRFGIWGGRWGSNPRPQEPQSCALPTELRPPYYFACARDQMNGAPGRIRTCDHPLRRRMLYPTELRALLSAFDSERRLQAPAIEVTFKSRLTQQQAVLDKRGES